MSEPITMKPIGKVICEQIYPAESPRQPGLVENKAVIELSKDLNLSQSLKNLNTFSHIWVIFNFHQNTDWKPLVSPPRGEEKQGVFATRSPYRPNPIGISSVKLDKIEDNKLFISNHDFLNDTPIFDIKPYIPYTDTIADANSGWLKHENAYKIEYTNTSKQQIQWIKQYAHIDLHNIIETQLSYTPLNAKKKRLTKDDSFHYLHHRTWKVSFQITEPSTITIHKIHSNYSAEELQSKTDTYNDKQTHNDFIRNFH